MAQPLLFRQDLFSNPVPQFAPAGTSQTEEVLDLLAAHYPALGSVNLPVMQCGGGGVNSRNFRVVTGQGAYVVKKHATAQGACAGEQARLAEMLWESGIAVPRFERVDHENGFIAPHGGAVWSVMEFVPGNYFSGAGNELTRVAGAHAELLSALESLDEQFPSLGSIRQPGPEAVRQLFQFDLHRAQWTTVLGECNAHLLDESWQELMQIAADCDIEDDTCLRLCHVDIHPHNIVMRPEENPVIIDMGALLHAQTEAFVAFALFKLSRQALARASGNACEISSQIDAAIAEYAKRGAIRDSSRGQLHRLASREILRRILLILSLNFEKQDTTWNHVLPIQLVALAECKAIFSNAEIL